jgi:hypothetical protein
MARFWVIAAVVAVAFMVYSLVDCALSDRARVRGPRKIVWILIILLLPLAGGILWFLIGRGRVDRASVVRRGPIAPDDDPAFLEGLRRNADQDERIRQMEKELAELGEDPDRPGPAGKTGPAGKIDGDSTDGTDKDGTDKDGTDSAGRRDV